MRPTVGRAGVQRERKGWSTRKKRIAELFAVSVLGV